jgi:hypothetical protein
MLFNHKIYKMYCFVILFIILSIFKIKKNIPTIIKKKPWYDFVKTNMFTNNLIEQIKTTKKKLKT